MIKKIIYVFLLCVMIILLSCGEGLAPEAKENIAKESHIIGKIIYLGGKENFPDSNSIFGIFPAAFKIFPKDSSGLLNEVLAGNVYLNFSSLPYPADSSEFVLTIQDAPVNLEYIAVSMQYDSTLEAQRIIGVYTQSGDNTKPSNLFIEKGKDYNIRIIVDFDNLPPQPFD